MSDWYKRIWLVGSDAQWSDTLASLREHSSVSVYVLYWMQTEEQKTGEALERSRLVTFQMVQ